MLRKAFFTSRLPVVVSCQPGNLTSFTTPSISFTMRSTIIGVLRFLTAVNNFVRAAIPLSISSFGVVSFSRSTASFAYSSKVLRNSMLFIRPCSCFSRNSSSFRPNSINLGSSACFVICAAKLISTSFVFLFI